MDNRIVPNDTIDRQSAMAGPLGPVLATARESGDIWTVTSADGEPLGRLVHPDADGIWEPVAAHEIRAACERLRGLVQLAQLDVVVVDEHTIRAHGPEVCQVEPFAAPHRYNPVREVGPDWEVCGQGPADPIHEVETWAAEAAAEKAADHGPAAGREAYDRAMAAAKQPEPLKLATGLGGHTTTSSIAAMLRRVAGLLDQAGGPIAPTFLSISMQVDSVSGVDEAGRVAAVDLLCSAVGTEGHRHQMSNGTIQYDELVSRWDGVDVDVFTAGIAPLPAELPTCGPTSPRTGAKLAMTPTRRKLLADMESCRVYAEAGKAWHTDSTTRTGQVTDAIAAGWCEEGPQDLPGRRRYCLTDVGREAAAAYDATRAGARRWTP
jgi:hypothetical protein